MRGGIRWRAIRCLASMMRRWIPGRGRVHRALANDGETLDDLRRHATSVYRRPLEIYLSNAADERLGDPVRIIEAFFAKELGWRRSYIEWKHSGLPLRLWLKYSLDRYVERLRRTRASKGQTQKPHGVTRASLIPPDPLYARACAEEIVARALEMARQSCEDDGMTTQWRVFCRHYHDGLSHAEIATETGVPQDRVKVQCRMTLSRLQSALRELFSREGVPPDRVDDEITALYEQLDERDDFQS